MSNERGLINEATCNEQNWHSKNVINLYIWNGGMCGPVLLEFVFCNLLLSDSLRLKSVNIHVWWLSKNIKED